MSADWSEAAAIAAWVYGGATLLLVVQLWRDRVQRDKQFHVETVSRRLQDLRGAFYDAWGYWEGHKHKSGDSKVDASQAGRVFEAFIRLECQLGLNDYKTEAYNLGFAIRTLRGVDEQLARVGVALDLFPPQYRQASAVVFDR